MVDLTIVIPSRGDPFGLWATVQSCEADLERSGLTYNYSIVSNGEEKEFTSDAIAALDHLRGCLDKKGVLKSWFESTKPMSPPHARNLGAIPADGNILCFFDNHCILGHDYFKRTVLDFKNYNMDVLHGAFAYNVGPLSYHYKLTLNLNFWGMEVLMPKQSHKPYQIAMGGHGAFSVRRSAWEDVGGYWEGFEGYAGEEPEFDFKCWLFGKTVWIDPLVTHRHWAGRRTYQKHFSDAYYRNLLCSARLIGGEDWMYKTYKNFAQCVRTNSSKKTMFDLLMDAEEATREYAKVIEQRRIRTLDEQLNWFRDNDIPSR